ncbi:hypothetical protein BOX15_Mlig027385g3, partial [Macrostomum lignano]
AMICSSLAPLLLVLATTVGLLPACVLCSLPTCPTSKEIVKLSTIDYQLQNINQQFPDFFPAIVCPTNNLANQTRKLRIFFYYQVADVQHPYMFYFNATGFKDYRGSALQLVLWCNTHNSSVSVQFEGLSQLSAPVEVLLLNLSASSNVQPEPQPGLNLTVRRINSIRGYSNILNTLRDGWPGYLEAASLFAYYTPNLAFVRFSRRLDIDFKSYENIANCHKDGSRPIVSPLIRQFGNPQPVAISFNTEGPNRDYCSPAARTVVIEIGGLYLPDSVQINMADRVLPGRASQFVLAIVFDIIGSGGACPASVSVRLTNWTSGGGDRPSLKLLYGCRDAGGLDLLNSGGNAVNVTIKAQPGLRRSEVPGPYLRSIRFEPESKHKIVIADVSFDPFTYEPDEAISQVQFRQLSPGQTLLILDRRVLANCTHSLAWAAMVRKRDSAIAEIDSNSDSCRLATLPDGSVGRLIVSGECGSKAKASKVSAYLAVQFNNWRSPPLTDKLGRYFRFFTWSDMSLASVEREGPQAALPGPEFEQNRMRIASQLAFRLSLTNSSSGRSSYPGNYTIELRPVRTDFLYGAVIENCRLEDADTGELLAELVAKGCTLPNSNWHGSPGFYRNRLLIRLAEFKHRSLIARCQFNPCYLVRPELTGLPAQLISQFGISDCGLVSKPCGRAHYLPLFDAVSQLLLPPSLPTVPALLQTSSPVQQVQQPPPHSQRCTPPQASSATPHYPLWSHALAALVSYALGLATLAAIWLILRRPWRRRRRRRRRQSATAIGGGGSHQVTTIAAIDVGVSGGNGLAHPRQHQQQRLALTRYGGGGGAVEGYRHRANETNGNCVHGFGDGNKTDSAKPLLGAPAPAGSNATAGSSSANCDLAGQEGELESDECHCRSTSGSNGASGSGGSSAPLSAVAAADRNSHCGAA